MAESAFSCSGATKRLARMGPERAQLHRTTGTLVFGRGALQKYVSALGTHQDQTMSEEHRARVPRTELY